MAHFAELNPENEVLRVLVVPDDQEHRGAEFLHKDLGLGGIWVQCSYTGSIRGVFPGQGFKYDPEADVFVAPVINDTPADVLARLEGLSDARTD